MIRFNNHLTSKLIRQNPFVVQNQFCVTTLRRFCEKKKTEEELPKNEEIKTEEEKETNESKRNWYTYLRKLRRFLAVLLKYGIYTYTGLLLTNHLIRSKYEFVENNLGFLKIDHFQRVLYNMHLSWLFMKDVFSLLSRQLPYLIHPIFFLKI